jgi:hypothetical protein
MLFFNKTNGVQGFSKNKRERIILPIKKKEKKKRERILSNEGSHYTHTHTIELSYLLIEPLTHSFICKLFILRS